MNIVQILNRLTYFITCKIHKKEGHSIDLSSDLFEVEVVRTLKTPYSIYVLRFSTDPEIRKFIDNLNPSDTIILEISYLLSYSKTQVKHYRIELAYITDESILPVKTKSVESSQFEPKLITILGIPKNSLHASIVPNYNKILFNTTVQEILEQCNQYQIIFETKPHNTKLIDQYLIEKQTFLKELQKLNYYYGIYKGALYRFFDEFENKWRLGDLSVLIHSKEPINIEYITLPNTKETKTQNETNVDSYAIQYFGKYYFSYTDILINDSYSVISSVESYNFRVVNHPSYDLYHILETNFKDLSNNVGLVDKTLDERINDILKQRYRNLYDHVGFEDSYLYFTSYISSFLKNLFSITLTFDTIVDLGTCLPGTSWMFKTKHPTYINIMGKYLANKVNIVYSRTNSGVWLNQTIVNLIRTNYKYSS